MTGSEFLPYADDKNSYWTGFYSSRQNFKEAIRDAQKTYMSSNHHLALSAVNTQSIVSPSAYSQSKLTEAIAISQHHEIVTGTTTHNVKNDFLDYIYAGID